MSRLLCGVRAPPLPPGFARGLGVSHSLTTSPGLHAPHRGCSALFLVSAGTAGGPHGQVCTIRLSRWDLWDREGLHPA